LRVGNSHYILILNPGKYAFLQTYYQLRLLSAPAILDFALACESFTIQAVTSTSFARHAWQLDLEKEEWNNSTTLTATPSYWNTI